MPWSQLPFLSNQYEILNNHPLGAPLHTTLLQLRDKLHKRQGNWLPQFALRQMLVALISGMLFPASENCYECRTRD